MIKSDLPLSWTNISLNEYMELQNLLLENEEGLSEEDLIMQEIQLLYGKNPYIMTMSEFKKSIEGLKFMQKEMPKMKVKDCYNLNGNIYYLHKSLSEFKMGQYIDYERILKSKKGVDVYADFIALFLTPNKDDSYGDGYDVTTVIKEIKQYMSIADATSIATFFLHLSKAYTVRFLWYSMHKATKNLKDRKTKRDLRKKTKQLIKMIIAGEPHHY